MTAEFPGANSYKDRHGRERWRYRHKGRTIALSGQPGTPEFEEHYLAAVEGRAPKKADIVRLPGAAVPRSLGAAWRLHKESAEWAALGDLATANNSRIAELFLASPVDGDAPLAGLWRDMPVEALKRRHLKMLLAQHKPFAGKNLLTTIRKMILSALDEEWIEADPTYKLKHRPKYKGFKTWAWEETKQFEKRWQPGTTPRLVYALALWIGNRRKNIATLRKDQRVVRVVIHQGQRREIEGYVFESAKTEKEMFVPVTPMLREALDAMPPTNSPYVVTTAYGQPFSIKSLTGRMADWTRLAGLPKGRTLHGLRKTLGKLAAEGSASTRQLMDILGHDDIKHAELYSREAEQIIMATEGMDRVVALVAARK